MKNSLSTKGLSLSQAQSISNLCNQRSIELSNTLSDVNNVEKTLTIGSDTYTETPAKPLPANVAQLIQEKARLAATQAFLMENIKAKDSLIKSIQRENYYPTVTRPESPEYVEVELKELVTEEWANRNYLVYTSLHIQLSQLTNHH